MDKKLRITIDRKEIEAEEKETVLTAARRAGIYIPTMCLLEGKKSPETCGVCMVKVEGHDGYLPACAYRVHDGMVVRSNTDDVRKIRRAALELLLSDHLGDCEALCERACPAHIDIPGFIRFQAAGRHKEALALIKKEMAFPGVLGRICPMFCERACRRKDIDQPVSVCALKRFAADWDMASKEPYRPVKKPPTGRKVAIVGSGIAGLTAAYFLLQDGHECMVFDSRERPGGIIRHAIPDFRLPASVVDYEIGRVKELGAQFVLGTSLGVQISLQDLRRDFDAVLLATGAPMEILPAIEGIEQAILAARFLEDVKEGVSSVGIAGAIVIGAGPAGPDAARALRRLGTSKVTLIPVGRPIDAAADEMHRENARKEGVEVLLDTTVETIERLDKFGFMIVIDRNGKRESLTAEQVLVSGETAENEKFFADLGIEGTPKGETVDRETMATNVQGVFAAGSVVRRRIHAVQASAMGSLAAGSISDYLSRKSRPKKRPIHVIMRDLSKEELGRMLEDASQKHRFDTRRSDRATMHAETDQGFDEDTAEREAKRCLQCACVAKNDCLLRDLSTEFDADPRAYVGERKKFERDTSHEYVVYESSKCIRCMKCVLIAEDADESLGLAVIGRGFQVRVGVPFNENIKAGLRETAARCAEACPTGALRTRQETR